VECEHIKASEPTELLDRSHIEDPGFE